MSNVHRQKLKIVEEHGSGDGQIGAVDTAVAGQPPPTERTRSLSDVFVDRMPAERAQKSASALLISRPHPDQQLQSGDLARVQDVCRPLRLEKGYRLAMSTEEVDQH